MNNRTHMRALREWSFSRVLLLSGGWVLACVLLALAWLFLPFSGFYGPAAGSGGIGVVSFGINALVLAIPIAPPLMLIVAWLVARRA